jgi:hypothetical protein
LTPDALAKLSPLERLALSARMTDDVSGISAALAERAQLTAERDAWKKLALAKGVVLAFHRDGEGLVVDASAAERDALHAADELARLGIDPTTGEALPPSPPSPGSPTG